MSTLLKVTLEFDDKIMTIEGNEARKWEEYADQLALLGHVHSMNPFDNPQDSDPIKWNIETK